MQDKPFSKGFVMRTTYKHMQRSIDISIQKSFERFKDFDNDPDIGLEIMETLSVLHTLRELLEEFKSHNEDLFKDK